MEYDFTTGAPLTEEKALEQAAAMGSFENEDGKVLDLGPGGRLQAPAGYLHRVLAGTNTRLVVGADLPVEKWTSPLNKEPDDRPEALLR